MGESVGRLKADYFKSQNLPPPPNLPVVNHWTEVLRTIETYPITILTGSTGCGKSTQVPQLLLEEMIYRREQHCNIIVTQPRRLGAISICDTVCKDRKWDIGSICGYRVGLDKQMSSDCRLQYVTTNIVVQSFIANRSLSQYTHIIVDEVHERHQDLDCLLYLLKALRDGSFGGGGDANGSMPKIILMSATVDTSVYVDYFGEEKCGFVSVEGTLYTVEERYLDDLPDIASKIMEANHRWDINLRTNVPALSLGRKHFSCVLDVIRSLDNEEEGRDRDRGAVLIFVPGIAEIRGMMRALEECSESRKYFVVPLHSSLPLEDQGQAFRRAPRGSRKIIVATNIAESSVTVRDIRFVIDFCLTKALVLDRDTGVSGFLIEKCSRASCQQRAGRAGRVQNGRVYRLITKAEYRRLNDYSIPEIARSPTDVTVLKVKMFGLNAPKDVLAKFITPPDAVEVGRAIIKLKEMQALRLEHNGKIDLDDGDLTVLGRVMANLPIDIQLSKLVVMGLVFGCYEECVKMAACLNSGDFLETFRLDKSKTSTEGKLFEYQAMLSWAKHRFSDPIMLMNIFDEFLQTKEQLVGHNSNELKDWAKKNNLRLRNLSEAYFVYEELKARLQRMGFVWRDAPNRQPLEPSMHNLFIMISLCGAFYPNYFVQQPVSYKEAKINCGQQNPLSTVIISGLAPRYAPLYEKAIRATLANCIKSDVQFSWQDMDVYLTFGSSSAPGGSSYGSTQVPIDMYLCQKYTKIHTGIRLPRIQPETAEKLLKQLGLDTTDTEEEKDENIPLVGDSDTIYRVVVSDRLPKQTLPERRLHFRGRISQWHPDDVFTLFVHINDRADSFRNLCNEIFEQCEEGSLQQIPPADVKVDMLALVFWEGEFHRSRVVFVELEISCAGVFLIDDGLTVDMPIYALYELPETMLLCNSEAPFAYKVQLAGVQSPDGHLVQPKGRHLLLRGKPCELELLSVIDGVLRVNLFLVDDEDARVSVNEQLLYDKLAIRMNESDFFRDLHERTTSAGDSASKTVDYSSTQSIIIHGQMEFIDPEANMIPLHGPRSPLYEQLNWTALKKESLRTKFVEVTDESVNQVTFAETGDNRRFIVAHMQRLTADKARLQLMQTTLVSNLTLMLPFVTLVFAPRAAYQPNKTNTAFVGAVCGLGGHTVSGKKEGQPDVFEGVSPENDLEVEFSHEMTTRDARLINRIRRLLGEAFGGNSDVCEWGDLPITKIQAKLQEATREFFNVGDRASPLKTTATRQIIKSHRSIPIRLYRWRKPTREEQSELDKVSLRQTLYRPHIIPRLRNKACNNILELLADFTKAGLEKTSGLVISLCPLCLKICTSPDQIKEHLITETHQANAAKIKCDD